MHNEFCKSYICSQSLTADVNWMTSAAAFWIDLDLACLPMTYTLHFKQSKPFGAQQAAQMELTVPACMCSVDRPAHVDLESNCLFRILSLLYIPAYDMLFWAADQLAENRQLGIAHGCHRLKRPTHVHIMSCAMGCSVPLHLAQKVAAKQHH